MKILTPITPIITYLALSLAGDYQSIIFYPVHQEHSIKPDYHSIQCPQDGDEGDDDDEKEELPASTLEKRVGLDTHFSFVKQRNYLPSIIDMAQFDSVSDYYFFNLFLK